MAQKVQTLLIDDIDGGEAESAMAAAHKAGHPQVALMILSGQVGVRSRRRGDWSVNDYRRELPAGAVAVLYVDYTAGQARVLHRARRGGAGDPQEALRG